MKDIQAALKTHKIDIGISTQAFDYICESTVYALCNADRNGTIESGIFIHTPPKLTPKQQQQFATAIVDVLFQNGKPVPGRLIPKPLSAK